MKRNMNAVMTVYFETEMYGPTLEKNLCGKHRDAFYSFHPNARSNGHILPVSCESCTEAI